jgi:hypothetical protein
MCIFTVNVIRSKQLQDRTSEQDHHVVVQTHHTLTLEHGYQEHWDYCDHVIFLDIEEMSGVTILSRFWHPSEYDKCEISWLNRIISR